MNGEILTKKSSFSALVDQPADALLALIGQYRDDPRPGKIDLGLGVYRDVAGNTPIMGAVKQAELVLYREQLTKSYLAPEGDARFVKLLANIVFGDMLARDPSLTGVQTPGGTGALRMAGDLIARANPDATIWIGDPSWANHVPIFEASRLKVAKHPFFQQSTQMLEFDAMLDALALTAPGDALLLHGCCHNPTGANLSVDRWHMLIELMNKRGVIPIVDLAYQGLGASLDEDAFGARLCLGSLPNVLIAYSCDKNFGLYRERVGALWAKGQNAMAAKILRTNMLSLARSNWSMPPDHGAALVRIILDNAQLRAAWETELVSMRLRIESLRSALALRDDRLEALVAQSGMFSLLPIEQRAVTELRVDHGIYLANPGRINIAGLQIEQVAPFVSALAPYLVSA
jgi:aromatic-amino-acid transaminase